MPTSPTPVDAAPTVPDRADRTNFPTQIYNFFVYLAGSFRTGINNLASNVYNNAGEAVTAATNAANSEAAADTSEYNAGVSAGTATTKASEASASAAIALAAQGAQAIRFDYSTTTTMADPGAGTLRLNNATLASVTAMAFDATSADTGNPDVSDFIATWGASTNTVKGHIILRKVGTPSFFAEYSVSAAVTDNTGWLQVTVAHVASNGTLSNADNLVVNFSRAGDKGADGVGTGDFKADGTVPMTGPINEKRGADIASASTINLTTATGNLVDVTGTTAITAITLAEGYERTVRFTGALTLTHGASLVLPGAANITTAAGDFAVFRGYSAGVVRCVTYTKASGDPIAASTLLAQGKHTIAIPAGAMTARTTNGAAAGTTETTTNKVMVKTLDYDQATAEYAQIVIPMPKSWDEGTITAQMLWSSAVSGTNAVVWACQAVALSDDDVLDAAFGTAQTVTDAQTAQGDLMITAETAAITIAGTPAVGDLVVIQIYRDATNGSDTLAGDARLHGVRIYYTINAATDA